MEEGMMRQLVFYMDYRKAESRGQLYEIWEKIAEERVLDSLFYDGSVRIWPDFACEILREGTLPFAVLRDGEIAGFSWLNCITSRMARTHFVIFRKFHGRKNHAAIGRHFYGYLLGLRDEHGFLFDCLYGITPEHNRLAIRAAQRCGWQIAGKIPMACFIAGENRSVAGVVVCATREILGNSGETGAIWEE